jgi:hypothetical protein
MVIAGIIVLVVGALLLWGSASSARRALALRTVERQTAAGLEGMRKEMTAEVGAGALRDLCAVEGTVECAQPLRAEVSGQACVYYAATVERKYEETREENGRTTTSTGTEQVASNTRSVEFELRDATGAVTVVPADAQFDARKVVERFDPAESAPLISLGGIALDLAPLAGMRRTVGYKVVEHVVGVGDKLYVLGEVRDRDGRVVVAKPRDRHARFIISARSRDELVHEASGRAWGLKIGALVTAVGGLALIVVGLIRR